MARQTIDRMPPEWITPTSEEVLRERAAIVGALSSSTLSQEELRKVLGVATVGKVTHDVGYGKKLFGDVLNETSPEVMDCRRLIAFRTAIHELQSDGVVESAYLVGQLFHVTGMKTTTPGGSNRSSFSQKFGPVESAGLTLTSRARGWSASEHEAFDPALYGARGSSRLITSDGIQLLQESLDAYRMGRFLSSAIVLGVFVETCWFEAAGLAAAQSSGVRTELAKPMPKVSTVQDELVAFFRADSNRTKRSRFLAGNLDTWATSTRQVRNFAAHGQVVTATSGSFSSAAGAMRIMDTYRNLEELNQALAEFNL